ncbi:MAG: NDP-hexose 2,3-dehydratase family protein [Proteobacteria bacterium]|nr:NDP-hexose 2,3-dehydratase family protein [Pseudomonadota bacterium]
MSQPIKSVSPAKHFLLSALTEHNRFQSTEAFKNWFARKKQENHFFVEQIPFSSLQQWYFEEETQNLKHASGRFFTIEGIRINTNFGSTQCWEQPIINQPEIGILGIITRKFDGIPYFLMQAKMEPGNVNLLQLSPTVQATKSNFTQVHGGRLPPYLEYFFERCNARFLIDQLQTEQAGRFLRKRNRNMIVEVDHDIEIFNDFCWLTLGQIKKLLKEDNFVNMDARTVLSCVPMPTSDVSREQSIDDMMHELHTSSLDDFSRSLMDSFCGNACNTTDEIISWFTELKTKYHITVERIPLKNVKQWKRTDREISHEEHPLFSVIAVSVEAGTREVFSWTQPLLKEPQQGLLGFITRKINGVLHFLMQAKVEPGNIDIIEIAPTVSCSAVNFKRQHGYHIPFLDYFLNAAPQQIRYSVIQSEEGGRFYHFLNRNMVIELKESDKIDLPENYIWMTLGQVMEFLKHGYMNIDARTLLACIGFKH